MALLYSIPVGGSRTSGSSGSTGVLEDENEDEWMLYREPVRELAAAADGTAAVG